MNTTGTFPSQDLWFVLDYSSRYVVQVCGAKHDLFTGAMALFVILPVWVWAGTLTLSLTRPEIYALLAKYTIGLLTVIQLSLMIIIAETPPILGCGPHRSFPSAQTSLSAYGVTMFLLFDRNLRRQSTVWRIMVIWQLLFVTHAVCWLGFASPASSICGVLLGTSVASLLYLTLIVVSTKSYMGNSKSTWLSEFMYYLETLFGTITVDTVLNPKQETHVAQAAQDNRHKDNNILAREKESVMDREANSLSSMVCTYDLPWVMGYQRDSNIESDDIPRNYV